MSQTEAEKKAAKAAYDKARRLADPERKRAASRAYYLANREKVLAKNRQWQRDHPDEVAARRQANPDVWREYRQRWVEKNPDANRLRGARYRARKNQNGGDLSQADWLALLDEFDGCCAYCNTRSEGLEIEHMTPVSRGGRHDKGNVVPACRSCNGRKGGMTLLEFLGYSSPDAKRKAS